MGRTSIQEIAPGRLVIHTFGLRELSKELTASKNKLAQQSFAADMKRAAESLADLARKYASGLGGDGDFASSISISGGRSGVQLKSTDPGAGVIEFARQGAARKSGGLAGVPTGAPPRALFAAINEGLDDVAANIERAIDDLLSRYLGREFTTPDR